MPTKKFDFECIYYTNELLVKLDEEDFFVGNLILPEKLRYIVMQLVQNNYDAIGKLGLSQEQMVKAIERAQIESFDSTLNEMVKEGMVAYTGMDNKGEYIAELTDAGRKADERNQKMIQTALEIKKMYEG